MSATDDDTELRDLLIQNLENNGVLNKLKAEMRAAVFLAMEEQDKLENKTPLINENLKKCLNTKDGRLVASLIMDFLQVFNLDFTLAVFQPEINWLNGLDSRDLVCRELGLSDSEVNKNSPLLLELVRRGQHKDTPPITQVLLDSNTSQTQVHLPEDKPSSGSLSKDSDKVAALAQTDFQQQASDSVSSSSGVQRERLDLEVEDDLDDGDSFFDDPLPKPQKMYGCRSSPLGDKDSPERTDQPEGLSGPVISSLRRGKSLNDLSLLAGDSEGERDDPLSEHSQSSGLRKVEASGTRESPGSVSGAPKPRAGGSSRTGASNTKERGFRDSKALNDGTGPVQLDDDVEYDDDFNSHRSDLSKSELSIGEEIEEVSIEGPDNSDKFDETTQDLSVSQLSQSHGTDYMEDVA
ncbi:FGFR1 oncogene partner isoform X2 [Betta splendens]|uniref:Centrosomal protein 43 n=1 Tax=Betta splendens TaxID=158456 RepID=A0A6P7LUZ9_BETSP|nr:FGFR1 oncogene partner isoform X2 [Betta splendens]